MCWDRNRIPREQLNGRYLDSIYKYLKLQHQISLAKSLVFP